ncbi:hypothetical protein ACMD2_13641 [Ananas comosus]|uniref:Uncharacterized protein n=1 Tax=Ananas comosus TaxID=4615 RepID=A0A199UY39_ANACO|nr:hypothetical protein ACMD2_13641 [Ananas comosus]
MEFDGNKANGHYRILAMPGITQIVQASDPHVHPNQDEPGSIATGTSSFLTEQAESLSRQLKSLI